MCKKISLVLMCVSLTSFCAWSDDEGGILMDGVTAHVNEHVVTISEVLALVSPEHRRIARKYSGDELKKRLKESYRKTVDIVVERYLVLDAYSEQDASLPSWVVDRRIEDIITSRFGEDRAKLMEALAADGMTFDEWRQQMLDRIIVSTMNSAHVNERARVSPGELRKEYDRNREKYSKPEKVKFRLIAQANDSEQKMEDILKGLKAGDDFAETAKKFSTGAKAADGGLWDWVEPKMLRDELFDAISKLKAGEISGIVETPNELYIVKLVERQEASLIPFVQVEQKIENSLRTQDAERLYVAWIERLKEKAYVKVFDVDLY